MHKKLLLALMTGACVNVLAQAGASAVQGQDSESARQQRRVELRSMLQAHRLGDRRGTDDEIPASRQLTSKERAEMRRQLRELQAERPSRP